MVTPVHTAAFAAFALRVLWLASRFYRRRRSSRQITTIGLVAIAPLDMAAFSRKRPAARHAGQRTNDQSCES